MDLTLDYFTSTAIHSTEFSFSRCSSVSPRLSANDDGVGALQAGRPEPVGFAQRIEGAIAGRQSADFQRQLRPVRGQFDAFARFARPKCHLLRIERRGGELVVSALAGQHSQQPNGQSQPDCDCPTQGFCFFRRCNRCDQELRHVQQVPPAKCGRRPAHEYD